MHLIRTLVELGNEEDHLSMCAIFHLSGQWLTPDLIDSFFGPCDSVSLRESDVLHCESL